MNKVMKKIAASIATLAIALLGATTAFAQTPNYTLSPWTYDPDATGGTMIRLNNNSVRLEKNVTTATNAAVGVTVEGVEGLSTNDLTLSFAYTGYCGAGAPRFNVRLSNGSTVFLGCAHGNDEGSGIATFTAGNSYGGVLFPTGETVERIDIVMDEQGQTTLSNISVNGTVATLTRQTLMNQCKNGGYTTFTNPTFRNQGQCVSYFNRQS